MRTRQIFILGGRIAGAFVVFVAFAGQTEAQEGGQNPTPMVITVTPMVSPTPQVTVTPGQPTAGPTPTADGSLPPDRFEPNNDTNSATSIGWQTEPGLTLTSDDVDTFTAYLKAGQMVRVSTTVYAGLDTRLK